MPGLVACGRRWDIGSDDLVFPEIAEIFIRTAWLITISVIVNLHSDSFDCESGYLMKLFYIGTLTITCLQLVFSMAVVAVSTQGGIMDSQRRKHAPKIVYVKLFILLPELVWMILGSYWAFGDAKDCANYIVLAVKILVIVGWCLYFCLIIGMLVIFDPFGHKHVARQRGEAVGLTDSGVADTRKLWELRCKLLCCCAASDEQSTNAFNDIAELLTEYFAGLDLVPTDVAAGLILVQSEQKAQPHRLMLEPLLSFEFLTSTEVVTEEPPSATVEAANGITPQTLHASTSDEQTQQPGASCPAGGLPQEVQDVCDVLQEDAEFHINKAYPQPKPWMNVYDASHFMKYALGSYGWPLYVYMNPCCGCCKIWTGCRSCNDSADNVVEDNCCQCNMTAIQIQAKVDREDVIFASFYNRVYEIPFYVVMDHERSSVVIAVRGTMSLRDALTDMTATCDDVDVDKVGRCRCHRGILQAAQYIKNTLHNNGILEKAFERGPDYRLVICGHSLGAGAAALLSLLLRPSYPELICFAFSPPGGLLSLPLARYTEDFVCSIVVGKDLIPRLGIVAMEDLKTRLLRHIRDSAKPKYKILASGLVQGVCGCASGDGEEAGIRRHLLDGNTSRTSQYTLDVPLPEDDEPLIDQNDLDDAILTSQQCRRVAERLYPPGHLLLIDESRPASNCFEDRRYDAAWARSEVFDEILVSPRMVSDHLPDVVSLALDQLADRDYVPRHSVKVRVPHNTS